MFLTVFKIKKLLYIRYCCMLYLQLVTQWISKDNFYLWGMIESVMINHFSFIYYTSIIYSNIK